MTYNDFMEELKAARVSGREFARLLRLHPCSVYNYRQQGAVPAHLATIARLLRLLAQNGVPFHDELLALDLKPRPPRGRAFAATGSHAAAPVDAAPAPDAPRDDA